MDNQLAITKRNKVVLYVIMAISLALIVFGKMLDRGEPIVVSGAIILVTCISTLVIYIYSLKSSSRASSKI